MDALNYKNGGKPKAGDVVRYRAAVGFRVAMVMAVHTNGTVSLATPGAQFSTFATDCVRGVVKFPGKAKPVKKI